jgi:hypothetical protein
MGEEGCMSGWTPKQMPENKLTQSAKFFLALGLFALMAFVSGSKSDALQPPDKGQDIDDRSPLPPADANREIANKLEIPNSDRAIFAGQKDSKGNLVPGTGIVDFNEIASEKKNSYEYQAWHEIVQHAKECSTAQLEEFARRDLTRDDLIGLGSPPRVYRLSLVRLEGKIARVRRLNATRSLRDSGTMEVYEAQLIPFDGPPTESMSIVFTDLPESLAAITQKPPEQWVDVNADAICAGYFFKVKQDPPQNDKIPVLIGKSVTMLPALKDQPFSASNTNNDKSISNPIIIDKNLKVFKAIKDDARMADGNSDNWGEAVAWNRVLLHARRFTPEELETNARGEVTFADLFEPIRKDYKLELVKFEGRLLMVRQMKPSEKLRAAGVETAYEGWLVPQNEPRGNPISIVFTDPLPDGLELGRVNKWVSFAGYSFKLMRYESGERKSDDPTKYVIKRAPLLLGRAIIVQPDPDAQNKVSWNSFVQVAVAVIIGLLTLAAGITWWFRRGDRQAKQEIITHRSKNPFGD